jgi:hypothetical protein
VSLKDIKGYPFLTYVKLGSDSSLLILKAVVQTPRNNLLLEKKK